MKTRLAALPVLALFAAVPARADLRADVAADLPSLVALYKELHANPELSFKESKSSARLASELKSLGFEVTTGVGSAWSRRKAAEISGEVREGVDGYGVVGVLRNGEGPTVLIRADMDALPLEERTNLPYASKVRTTDYRGVEAGVMHACGHDVHMTSWVGAARRLVAMKDQWKGTLVMVAQPAEELGLGALAMLDDGLFSRFPKPDYNLALHVNGVNAAGTIAYTPEYALASVDSVDIFIKGVGGHGAMPHLAKDPIVIGAEIVNALQTLVSRELDPLDSGVVTVGAFNAGTKHNIIPDGAHLQITVRSYKEDVRQKLLDGIRRIARAQAASAGLPEKLMPEVKVENSSLAATYNDPALSARIASTFKASFGEANVIETRPTMGGEDFAYFGKTADKIPSFIFWIGGSDPKAVAAATAGKGPVPHSNHSPFFAPLPEPTLKTGVEALTVGALELFKPANAN
ncbi:MAG: amidohydrolase [Parvularculaceae bacterium]|nr:amidohydrolase [Parvularculaceae bacterium]